MKILVLYIKKYTSFKAAGTVYNRAYEYHAKYFASLVGTKIIIPKKYYPRKEFLQYHMDEVFKG